MKEKYNTLRRKQVLRVIFVLGALCIVGTLILSSINVDTNAEISAKYREQKDDNFRKSIKSPIKDKDNFSGLNYFPYSEKYRVNAFIEFTNDTQLISMLRNDGKRSFYTAFARANFKIDGQLQTLMMYRHPDDLQNTPILFIPFYDASNGTDTYGGGRYLDIELKNNKSIIIDFNYAYNPFCVYNYQYTCPIPPAQNKLTVPILAGEKTFNQVH